MQTKIENWLEDKIAAREDRSGPVEIFIGEIEDWADDVLDIYYGDSDNPPSKTEIVKVIDKYLEKRGK